MKILLLVTLVGVVLSAQPPVTKPKCPEICTMDFSPICVFDNVNNCLTELGNKCAVAVEDCLNPGSKYFIEMLS